MKLTPQPWIWDGPNPRAAWLPDYPADVPVVWQAQLAENPDTQAHLVSLLSAAECTRLARFQLREDQQRFVTGRGLLRRLVGAHLNLPAERVEFDYGPFGKPFTVPRDGVPALHFNVAHSGKLVLLAFSPVREVGVDVEEVRQEPDLETIARQIFSADEYRQWFRLNPEERLAKFYQAWTRHEAGLKAMGLGFVGERNPALDMQMMWFDLELPEGYQGAVGCLRSPASDSRRPA
jgi:4'-phosphopantetheinyl transferase